MITLNLKTRVVERRATGDVDDPADWSTTVPAGSPGTMAGHAEIEAMCAGFRLVRGWHRDERSPELWHMGELISSIPQCRRVDPGE